MNANHHNTLVANQFNPQAQAYLTSSVHANGEDLDHIVDLVGERPHALALALDLGCGGGHVAFQLSPLLKRVVAYDMSESMLDVVAEEAKHRGLDNIDTQVGIVECLPFPKASFDIVVSRHSAHHWLNVAAGLSEIRRVLKPDGLALFMDVISPGTPLLDTWLQSIELLRDPSHVRNMSLAEWQILLQTAGFKVGTVKTFRLKLAFLPWVERMRTPAQHVTAIRSLQQCASTEISDYFALEHDGSFTIDTMLITAGAIKYTASTGVAL